MHQYSWLVRVGPIAGIWAPQPMPRSLLKMTPAAPSAVASTCPLQPDSGDFEATFTSLALIPADARSSPAGAIGPEWQIAHLGVKIFAAMSAAPAQVALSTAGGGLMAGGGVGAAAASSLPGLGRAASSLAGAAGTGAASSLAGGPPLMGATGICGAAASTKIRGSSSRGPGQPNTAGATRVSASKAGQGGRARWYAPRGSWSSEGQPIAFSVFMARSFLVLREPRQ